MTENPCRYCTDRDPYCHSTCQKYKDWRVIYEAEKAARAHNGERYAMTYAQKRAYWASKRRNPYRNCTKRFSE